MIASFPCDDSVLHCRFLSSESAQKDHQKSQDNYSPEALSKTPSQKNGGSKTGSRPTGGTIQSWRRNSENCQPSTTQNSEGKKSRAISGKLSRQDMRVELAQRKSREDIERTPGASVKLRVAGRQVAHASTSWPGQPTSRACLIL